MPSRNFQHLVKGNKVGSVPSLMNVMMQLRKCCNHPFLLRGVEDFEMDDKPQTSENVHSNLIEASGKLVLIDKLLPKLLVCCFLKARLTKRSGGQTQSAYLFSNGPYIGHLGGLSVLQANKARTYRWKCARK